MRWPADVLAHVCLAAGMMPTDATVAVAVALAATEGDDKYLWVSDSPGGRTFMGAWAIPSDLIAIDETLDPLRLSQAASIVRRLTGPQGDQWAWSDAYAIGDWRWRLDDASAGVAHPRPGIADDLPQMRMAMGEAIEARRSAIESARASMLGTVEHLRKLV